jgi:hypothetical protein
LLLVCESIVSGGSCVEGDAIGEESLESSLLPALVVVLEVNESGEVSWLCPYSINNRAALLFIPIKLKPHSPL